MDEKGWLGALAEAAVVERMLLERWHVFTSVSGKAPSDLVATKDDVLVRVEVKGCATRTSGGGYAVSLRSVRANRTGFVVRHLDEACSDLLAVYLQPEHVVCFMPTASLAGRNTLTLHGHPSESRPRHLVSDYASIPVGAVAEWTKATALKVVDPRGSVGSNPTRSAAIGNVDVSPGAVAESG